MSYFKYKKFDKNRLLGGAAVSSGAPKNFQWGDVINNNTFYNNLFAYN